jgi:hypothetical protein
MLLGVASPIHAAIIFYGEDLGLGENTRLASHPNSDLARNNFLGSLSGVGTESLELFADNALAPIAINFGSAGTATLQGSGRINTLVTGTNAAGRYPISGNNYWETDNALNPRGPSGDFRIDFSTPIAAFGFYGTDIGDFNGQLTLTLLTAGGSIVQNIGNSNVPGGGVLYFGLIVNPGQEFTRATFGNTNTGTDFFGFDDFSIGTREQVPQDPGGAIPEPTTFTIWGLGALVLGLTYPRRKRLLGT